MSDGALFPPFGTEAASFWFSSLAVANRNVCDWLEILFLFFLLNIFPATILLQNITF